MEETPGQIAPWGLGRQGGGWAEARAEGAATRWDGTRSFLSSCLIAPLALVGELPGCRAKTGCLRRRGEAWDVRVMEWP